MSDFNPLHETSFGMREEEIHECSTSLNSTQTVQGGHTEMPSPTNDDFLHLMFGNDIDDAVVCSNTTPPDTTYEAVKRGMWAVTSLKGSGTRYKNRKRQNYTCVSSFNRNADGSIGRKIENFKALHFIVLDDIGSKVKVDPRDLGLGEPTCIIETSPGNCQWFYKLWEPVRDVSKAEYLMKQVLATKVHGHEMTDQGAKGVTRLCKLPQGMNLKLKLGTPWDNRVLSWRPDLAYKADEIAAWFSKSLEQVPKLVSAKAAPTEVSSVNPLILALRDAGMLKATKPSSSGWWDITCPQVDGHTDGLDNGTAVMVRSDGTWTLHCHHGHCLDLKANVLYDELARQGYSVSHPHERDPELIRMDFELVDENEGATGTPAQGGKPTIKLLGGELPLQMNQCAHLLRDVVYKRAGNLVRIGREQKAHCEQGKNERQASLVPVTVNWLKRELTERAVFLRPTPNGWKPIDCPTNIAKALVDGTDDATFKQLTALSTVPFLRIEGTVCETPGYDSATGIYYEPLMEFPKLPEHPTKEDARAALDEILDLVKQFPIANGVSRAVFLADVLTALARPTLPKSPMVLYAASMAGSGKTLMASISNLIAYGHGTTHPWPNGNEDELRKVFTAALLAGDSVLVFDNVPNGYAVQSAALSQFVTSAEYADRKLGESERLKFVNRTRVVLTGNNVTLASDNARRTIICELQLKVESLRERREVFEHPALASYILRNRARFIMGGLIVLRAYALHPSKLNFPPLDSFEDWSWRVRDALIWLGEDDPVAGVDYGNDGAGELGAAFLGINKVLDEGLEARSDDFTANELAMRAEDNPDLRTALVNAGCSEPISSHNLGCWMRKHKNRIAAGYQLIDKKKTSAGVNKWQILRVTPESSAGDWVCEFL